MDLPSSESDRVLARIEVMTQEGEGSLPQPRVLHEELLMLTNELDALGGEDPAVLEKFRRAENLVSRRFVLSRLRAPTDPSSLPSRVQLSTLEKDQATLEQRQRTITKNITSFRVSSRFSTPRFLERQTDRRCYLSLFFSFFQGKWLPELRKLVANFNKKFSASMDALDNRGEIRIKEHEGTTPTFSPSCFWLRTDADPCLLSVSFPQTTTNGLSRSSYLSVEAKRWRSLRLIISLEE